MPSEFAIFTEVFARLIEKLGADKAEEAAHMARQATRTAMAVWSEEPKKEEKKPS